MNKIIVTFSLGSALLVSCTSNPTKDQVSSSKEEQVSSRIPILFDTDANNELDDQHALAYLLFNGETFDVRGVTVNATFSGGAIQEHYNEAERILKLCNLDGIIPLYSGANGNFEEIRNSLDQDEYDGKDAVEFTIQEARKPRDTRLVLMPVGKLTNIALALEKAPDIKSRVRIVWLGSNYPEPGEYNQVNDIPALNYILDQVVQFEMVMVRYGKPSGSDAVRATPTEIEEKMPGAGPISTPVVGRHGKSFTNFGDYSVDLFRHIELHGDPPSRALFDMVAVAIVKNPSWGEANEIPAPIVEGEKWKERPKNSRKIVILENFDRVAIIKDFYDKMKNPIIVEMK
ncbi:MAG: nucleoside hydrolase [Bacteroidetes bacterium]|nr:nucleoside hydrolase [Bacteroidota bacterium]MDA1119986.1 nucleoside hydrolase [Bacteroidota bacterium]